MEAPLVEQLKRISEQLKQTREQAGIELEKVASETFIPLRLLKAMDEGKFERLPEPVFVQGFIRRYGDAVGLDGKSLSMEFAVQPPTLRKPPEEYLSRHPEDDAPAAAPRNPRKSKLKVPEPLPPEPAVVPGSDEPAVAPPVPVAPTESVSTTESVSSDPQAAIAPASTESTLPHPVAAADIPVADMSEPDVSEPQAPEPQTAPEPEPTPEVGAAVPPPLISESTPEAVPARTTNEAVGSAASTPTPEPIVAASAPENATPAPEPVAPPEPAAVWSPTPVGNIGRTGQTAENNKLILGLVGVAAAALLVVGGFFLMQPKSGSDTENSTSSSTQTQTTPEPPKPQPTPALDAPITLNVEVTGDSWTEVIADGKIVVSEILPQGTTRTFKAQERLSITSGNAQGVTYSLNNQPKKPWIRRRIRRH